MSRKNRLDRHTIDLIARAVVSGRRGYGKKVDLTADFIAGLMRNRLEAVGAAGVRRAPRRRPSDDQLRDRQIRNLLLRRAEKYLASYVLVESVDGSRHPR